MTPPTAPSFYRFTLAPASVVRNVLECADRAATVSAIAVLQDLFFSARRAFGWSLTNARLSFAARYGSSEGMASQCFCRSDRALRRRPLDRRVSRRRDFVQCALAICRNAAQAARAHCRHRSDYLLDTRVHGTDAGTRRLSDLSAQVVRDIADDPTTTVNVAAVFGTLLNKAMLIETGRHLDMLIDPPPPEAGPGPQSTVRDICPGAAPPRGRTAGRLTLNHQGR